MSLLLYYFQELKKTQKTTTNPNQNQHKISTTTTTIKNTQKEPHSSHHHCPASPQHNPQHFKSGRETWSLQWKADDTMDLLFYPTYFLTVKSLLNVMSPLLQYCYYCYPDYKIWGISVWHVFLEFVEAEFWTLWRLVCRSPIWWQLSLWSHSSPIPPSVLVSI